MGSWGRLSVKDKARVFKVFREYRMWREALRASDRLPFWYEDEHNRKLTAHKVKAVRGKLRKLVGGDFPGKYREWAVLEELTKADHAL